MNNDGQVKTGQKEASDVYVQSQNPVICPLLGRIEIIITLFTWHLSTNTFYKVL